MDARDFRQDVEAVENMKSEINKEKGRADELRNELRSTHVTLQKAVVSLAEAEKQVSFTLIEF